MIGYGVAGIRTYIALAALLHTHACCSSQLTSLPDVRVLPKSHVDSFAPTISALRRPAQPQEAQIFLDSVCRHLSLGVDPAVSIPSPHRHLNHLHGRQWQTLFREEPLWRRQQQ